MFLPHHLPSLGWLSHALCCISVKLLNQANNSQHGLFRSARPWQMSSVDRMPSACSESSEQVAATVLQLVVQHADVQLQQVTRWLQVSKSVRQALQQAVGHLSLSALSYPASIQQMTGMAQWLPCHAGLVSRLVLGVGPGPGNHLESPEWRAVEQMLSLALQLSSCCRSGRTHLQQASGLQLHSFETDFVFQPAALRSLAASSQLTELNLYRGTPKRFTAEVCSALSGLRGLQKLSCWLDNPPAPDEPQPFPVEFAAALAGLTQLTEISAIGCVPAATLGHLPASLYDLRVGSGHAGESAAEDSPRGCSSHLTKLQSLHMTISGDSSVELQLPVCLLYLELAGPAKPMPELSQLLFLYLVDAHTAIPQLQYLEQQPQLQRLELGVHSCSQQHLQQVAGAMSRCTQLTRLHFENSVENSVDGTIDMSGMQMQWRKLPRLQRLKLTQVKWDFEGFSQLTVLSSLTKLKLDTCDIAGVGLAVVFQQLTGLRKLGLYRSLPNDCLLVAVAGLSNLEYLRLLCPESELLVTSTTLTLLSPLTKLTQLILGLQTTDAGQDAISDAAVLAFLNGMPHLTQIVWN